MRKVSFVVYSYDELSEKAKEVARRWYRECQRGDADWHLNVFEDVKDQAATLGIRIGEKTRVVAGGRTQTNDCIWFSGFSSQGDGACFEGFYSFMPAAVKEIASTAPDDATLRRIAVGLADVQSKHENKLQARIVHRGRYYHSGCMDVDVFHADREEDGDLDLAAAATEVRGLLRSFADWIYRQLEQESEWLDSDEHVEESIRINGHEFTEDGRRSIPLSGC